MGLSVFALQAAVLTTLNAQLVPDDADVVDLGLPAEVPAIALFRRVYVLDAPEDTPTPVFVGSTQLRREEYALPIALEVLNYSGNSLTGRAETLTMMQALVSAIEGVCLADPSWGGAVMQSGLSLTAPSSGPVAAQAGGWIAHAILELHVMRQGV